MNELAFFVQQIINGLSIGIIYALMAVGLTLIFSIMDVLNFAHGELFMLGAYFCYWSIDLIGLPFMLSLVAGILVVAFISMVLERVVFRPIRGNILASIMASLGLMFVLQTLAAVAWGTISRSMHSPFKASVLRWRGLFIPYDRLFAIIASLCLFIGLWWFIQRTRMGKAMRATSLNREAAVIKGINIDRVYMVTFTLAGALAAAAGGILGSIYSVAPDMGLLPLLKSIAVIIVGGLGNIPAAMVGGCLIGLSEALGAAYLSANLRDIYCFVILVVVLLVRPQGLLYGWRR
jgi:branched-chain amino acid transport system permease protein